MRSLFDTSDQLKESCLSGLAVGLIAITLAGCSGENSDGQPAEPLRTLNPSPTEAYTITVVLKDAPGPFDQVDAAVQYDVTNPGECGELNRLSGAIPRISSSENLPLTRVSATEYTGVMYADQILEEDYYGRATCQWKLIEARVSFRASEDPMATWFVGKIGAPEIRAHSSNNTFFWAGYYPNAEIDNYVEFGNKSLSHLTEEQKSEFFEVIMSAQGADQTERPDDLEPPSPQSVLRMIYHPDSDDAPEAEGVTPAYWFGHNFDLNGQRYFTGFTSYAGEADGAASENRTMKPGHVAIGQVTLLRNEQSDPHTWTTLSTDGYVGEFGRNGQADAIDETRTAQAHELADGGMLLAVPTQRFEQGVATRSYAILLFDLEGSDNQPFRQWSYVGSIPAGSDNAASCEDGGVLTCIKSSGVLTVESSSEAGLPLLRVELAGKTMAGPGEARTLGPSDAQVFKFDAETGQYAR